MGSRRVVAPTSRTIKVVRQSLLGQTKAGFKDSTADQILPIQLIAAAKLFFLMLTRHNKPFNLLDPIIHCFLL